MSNKEKIEEIVIDAFKGWGKVGFTYEEMIAILSKLAEWKDEQYKEMFEVPDYCKSFEEITNYIGHDVFAMGYNRARDFCIESFKEYLKSKKSQNGFNKLNTVCDVDTIDMIIDELIENFKI